MTDRSPKPPEALLRAVSQDLRPVKPSPRPLQLALRMAVLAILVSPIVIVAIGLRPDAERMGLLLTWVASTTQFVVAVSLIWIAARESTPASLLPRAVVHTALSAAAAIVILNTYLTFRISPQNEGLRLSRMYALESLLPANISGWVMAMACAIGSTIAGGVLVLIFSMVFRKSLANRPMMAGLLYGAGAGLAINASWRIACPISTPLHALGAHGAAIIATALLGAGIGRLLGSSKSTSRQDQPARLR